MKCPYCGNCESQVIDSRDAGSDIRRRRECVKCGKRFTTYERIETVNLAIIKKDNTREQYDRIKLKTGILKACEKRSVTNDQVEKMLDEIEKKIMNSKSTEIKSTRVGELVMNRLKTVDKVAYIRFASVYRDFTDLESFEKELKTLLHNRETR
ncbi:MAG: transcriptional regulator NrdR [Nanoarchaeota archaeon]|nr:transcriptional regulator NrdR [Nanoarchaeota archaeon]